MEEPWLIGILARRCDGRLYALTFGACRLRCVCHQLQYAGTGIPRSAGSGRFVLRSDVHAVRGGRWGARGGGPGLEGAPGRQQDQGEHEADSKDHASGGEAGGVAVDSCAAGQAGRAHVGSEVAGNGAGELKALP